ncbi:MAG: 2-succinyl-5-enolpyruvyl-6-hydroxy-3-cyclohexene-1-carboxylic-acid synthase [Candidatus Protochlamydia sp.]|nr:2-succinyl-5-enolpyruvyl-6-hydroxy-3-cyclohexene-1-carboxylic-acid synthase [Candidatus Protochlamydia sp.]
MNNSLTLQLVQEVLNKGVKEFCLSPGARNAPLIYALSKLTFIKVYLWPEERSAAFFALGRIKATGRPVAVLTTSGTAAAELLPAAVEAHYTSLPLLLITADRPRRYRGTGAPQSIEQLGIFSHYVHYAQDLEGAEVCQLEPWTMRGPAHLNVCFEEPKDAECKKISVEDITPSKSPKKQSFGSENSVHEFDLFIESVDFPLVIVGELEQESKESIISFLLRYQAPVYLESQSGLRENPLLKSLEVKSVEKIWEYSAQGGYPIDGVLRIGGIPTARLWRDLEEGRVRVCSVSQHPFSGLSCAGVVHQSPASFFSHLNENFEWDIEEVEELGSKTVTYQESLSSIARMASNSCSTLLARTAAARLRKKIFPFHSWLEKDQRCWEDLLQLFEEEPLAEQSLIHALSKQIPTAAKIYLGNSLPIREWDQAATRLLPHPQVAVNRGANGIDGQIATFLGYCSPEQENWAILGDLTALYDLVAPWILPQLPPLKANLVIVNNGGGQIFGRMFAHQNFRNQHDLSFKPLADFWKWSYERWETVPSISKSQGGRLIELIPDSEATRRFLEKLRLI